MKRLKTLRDAMEVFLSSQRKPNSGESDDGNKHVICFTGFFYLSKIKIYSHYTSKGELFVKRLNRPIRNFLRKPLFEKSNADCLVEITTETKNPKKNETVMS